VDSPQYVLESVRKDEEFILYRGKPADQTGSPSVLLLTPASERPALETLKKLEHEYSLRDELDSAWAVRPFTLSELRGQTTLVLEDPGGETLDQLLQAPMEMTQFLRFAIGLATALSGLRKRELIYKDVKPANVLVSSATGQVRLMGFGIASRLPRERQAPKPPEFIAGTLPYMAPEQTGRMNRSIDSRSDLYALGVMLDNSELRFAIDSDDVNYRSFRNARLSLDRARCKLQASRTPNRSAIVQPRVLQTPLTFREHG